MKILAALTLILACAPAEPQARPKKIVLLAGPLDSHPKDTHEYERNIFLLKHCIETSPAFKGARVEAHVNGWPADPAALDDADTIFITSGGGDRKLEDHPLYVGDRLQVLERQMKRGCGVIFHHWSTFHPAKHHDAITEWAGGYFDYETGPGGNKWYSKIETRDWMTAIGAPHHPIARGVKPFKVKEEFYFKIRFRDEDPRLQLILLKDGGEPRESAVGWAVERKDGGRGFGFTGGHFFSNWWLPDFRRLVLNAIAWTAKIDVPDGGVESTLEEPVRALILTGHNHPAHDWKATTAALIHVLEQEPRMKVDVTQNPEDLAGSRLDAVDLLVLNYNNWDRPGLSDAAKANLLKYLGRGGGLSVIHFADGAWNKTLPAKDSEWEDYRGKIVRRAWMHPESAHDPYGPFAVTITPVKHEVTAGLAPFETVDELYVKQKGELPIEPLATAKSKVTGQDEPMAWAYDVEKARVFQTVLGHGADSIRKAAPLIRRGSTWAARRTPLGFDPPIDRLDKAVFRSGSRWTGQAPPEPPKPKVLPSDPGLDGGKGGHWGTTGEKDWADARWNAMDVGPFVSSALKVGPDTLLRAISIKVGDKSEGGVVFDADSLSFRAGWTGKFIEFSPARYGLIEKPRIAGEIQWTAPAGPKGRYRGLIVRGNRVGITYEFPIRDEKQMGQVSEWPWLETHDGLTAFSRTIMTQGSFPPPPIVLASLPGSAGSIETVDGEEIAVLRAGDKVAAAWMANDQRHRRLVTAETRIEYHAPPFAAESAMRKMLVWSGPKEDLPKFAALIKKSPAQPGVVGKEEPENLTQGLPPRWPAPLVMKGRAGTEKGPYVVDTLTVPYENPWKALMFLSGVDFFVNGDAAVSTIHGDVWRVSGIDAGLEKLSWKRFATGLYQPLGLRVVDGDVLVLGRDRITRLVDDDRDGEADHYENFCSNLPTSAGGHDYITCLETDAQGNFYFVSWHGLYKVSADGKKTELLSTGFRNPNGMSVGPDGTITVAPQEGEWTPASALFVARPGSYHGYGGPKVTPERPLGYDAPLCWIPRGIDNSTGGQVWVTSKLWGPIQGQLLNLSFGQSSMMLVLREQVDGQWQGGVVPMKVGFASGAIRGRFRPQDGQLYVVGTKGWVSNATRDGSLQRVRYTGAKVHLPVEMHAVAGGLRLRFAEPLDREIAESGDSWSAEQWNYLYAAQYGSKEYSAINPALEGHDPVDVKSAKLSDDGCTVFLQMPSLRPVMQLRLRYSLRGADGATVKGEIDSTIHRLGK